MSLDIDSGWWELIVIAHLAATWLLVGVIWTIQLVHYPSFSSIATETYATFQDRHMRSMGQLIGLPWLVEGICVLALFAFAPDTQTRVIATIGGLLEAVIIGVTIGWAIPAHTALTAGFDPVAHRTLLRWNWVRTIAWTARGVIAVVLVVALTGR